MEENEILLGLLFGGIAMIAQYLPARYGIPLGFGAICLALWRLGWAGLDSWQSWLVILLIVLVFWRVYSSRVEIGRLFTKNPGSNLSLKVTITNIEIARKMAINDHGTPILVTMKFEPSDPPIQLGKVNLVYKDNPIPPTELPTKLIERVGTYEVEYILPIFSGTFKIEIGLLKENKPNIDKWPQAYLHILAGDLDFTVNELPFPTLG